MNEEEKKAIEELKKQYRLSTNVDCITTDIRNKYAQIILNLIEKQQKELNNLKEIEQHHKADNGLLRQELDMQIEHNKELEATLKQTQDSWFEDTQKLEQEKEKNKEYEKQLDLDYVDKNYISKDKLKFILSKLNISDIEPWSTYKIDGQILFDLQELL